MIVLNLFPGIVEALFSGSRIDVKPREKIRSTKINDLLRDFERINLNDNTHFLPVLRSGRFKSNLKNFLIINYAKSNQIANGIMEKISPKTSLVLNQGMRYQSY